jgi:hypothetical protein
MSENISEYSFSVTVLAKISQTITYITDIFRTQTRHEANVEQDTGTNLTQPVSERLFYAIIFLLAGRRRIISYLGDKMHGTKVGITKIIFVYYNADLEHPAKYHP